MSQQRVQKYLSDAGVASRREVERWIQSRRLKINGKIAELGQHVDGDNCHFELDGKPIKIQQAPKVYWLLHKPAGMLCSHEAEEDMPTIYELDALKKVSFKVNHAGRLDYMTEGLLVLSNDGDFIHKLTHPSFEHKRRYYALSNRLLTEEELERLQKGIKLEDGPTGKVFIKKARKLNLGASDGCWYDIEVSEGRNRFVRRLFEHFNVKVLRLVRYGFGPLELDEDLPLGQYRALSKDEIKRCKSAGDK